MSTDWKAAFYDLHAQTNIATDEEINDIIADHTTFGGLSLPEMLAGQVPGWQSMVDKVASTSPPAAAALVAAEQARAEVVEQIAEWLRSLSEGFLAGRLANGMWRQDLQRAKPSTPDTEAP